MGTTRFQNRFWCWIVVFGIYVSRGHAQLKVELNFGENDNYILLKRSIGSAIYSTTIANQPKVSGNYRLVIPTTPSPGGGNCLDLNGSNEYLLFPPNADIQITGKRAFSVSMWMKYDASTPSGDIIQSDNGFIAGYRLYLQSRQLALELRDDMKETFLLDSILPSNQWIHIGFVCDAARDSVFFYLNGIFVHAFRFRVISQIQTGSNACIGVSLRHGKPFGLKMQMDRFRFFSGKDTIFENIANSLKDRKSFIRRKTSHPEELPIHLPQNYPNPFNQSTRISYTLQKSGTVSLRIYDLLGNRIRTLAEGEQPAGTYEHYWNGTDFRDSPVPSGIYMIRLEMDEWILTRKMVLVK